MLEMYFKYPRVIARFRRGALGNEVVGVASDLSRLGYKRDSAKLYLARIAHFSAYASARGCRRSTAIPHEVVERYLRTRPSVAARWASLVAVRHAARCFPKRFTKKPLAADS